MLSGLLNLLFPPQCRICRKKGSNHICRSCFNDFVRLETTKTYVYHFNQTTAGKTYFTSVNSAGSYEGVLKEAIRQFKYKNGKLLAPYLALFMRETATGIAEHADCFTYVPITRRKELRRGFNQSRLLASELSKTFKKPCRGLLLRTQDGEEQNKSKLDARVKNVSGSFRINKHVKTTSSHFHSVILVDDVFTTGSTVNECARILREADLQVIHVLTLARTPLSKR